MIQELKISTHSVFLQSISLTGHFNVINPNKLLAVSYEIEPLYDSCKKLNKDDQNVTQSMTSSLTIFPKSGLLLKEETQKIIISVKNRGQCDLDSFLSENARLVVKYTLNNNYNKILIKNHIIKPFPIEECKGHNTISVEVGTDYVRIKQQIQNQILFNSTIGKQTSDISQILSSPKKDDELYEQQQTKQVCDIIHNLELNSKIKENQISKNNDKIDLSVNSSKYFGNNQQQNITLGLESARDISFSQTSSQRKINAQFSSSKSVKKQKPQVNSFQLLIMAIFAAFFFSLGSNLRYYLTTA